MRFGVKTGYGPRLASKSQPKACTAGRLDQHPMVREKARAIKQSYRACLGQCTAHKILIGRHGEAIQAFGPRTEPEAPEITAAIEKAL